MTSSAFTETLFQTMTSPIQVVYDVFPSLIFLIDHNGVVQDYRIDSNLYSSIHPASSLAKRIQDALPQEIREKTLQTLKKIKLTRENARFTYNIVSGNKEQWFEARFSLIDNDHIIISIRNITDEKQKEAQFQRQLKWLGALQAIDLTIASSMDLSLTLSMLLSHVTTQLEVDAADILILQMNETSLELSADFGFRTSIPDNAYIRLGVGYAGRAALERRIIHITDLSMHHASFLHSPSLLQEGFVDYYAIPLIAKGNVKGVLEVFHRTPTQRDAEWLNFLETLGQQAAIAIDNAMLFDDLQRSNTELIQAYNETIEGWSHALDLRDQETEYHTRRVTDMTLKLACLMDVSNDKLVHIQRGAVLHDIGKVGVPDEILLKPGELTEEEWAIMRQHPKYALEMLAPIRYLKPALDIPHYHHEKWDGSGYPHGLKGTQIPLAARIFAVADVYDALTSDRPYRLAWSPQKAKDYICSNAGTHFDPRIVSIFTKMIKGIDQCDGIKNQVPNTI